MKPLRTVQKSADYSRYRRSCEAELERHFKFRIAVGPGFKSPWSTASIVKKKTTGYARGFLFDNTKPGIEASFPVFLLFVLPAYGHWLDHF
ncbi:MAG: hypothetical protein HFF45_07705 [Lawsonibacter sp.]|nr:hypothetical protein [Lawsonibacter sp.]